MLDCMSEPSRSTSNRERWRRVISVLAIALAVSASWAIVAEYLLNIEPRYWLQLPLGLLLVVAYWVPAWGAIGSYLDERAERQGRSLRALGCLGIALLVFLLLCALLAVVLFP